MLSAVCYDLTLLALAQCCGPYHRLCLWSAAHRNPHLLKSMRSPRLLFAALFTVLMCSGAALQAQQRVNDQLDQAIGSSSANSIAAEPLLTAFPKMATTTLSIRLSGISNGSYWLGIKDEYGNVLLQGFMALEDGVPLVIDIEKVETGIYTVFALVDGVELASTFCKVD
jgi:hypothetical protein